MGEGISGFVDLTDEIVIGIIDIGYGGRGRAGAIAGVGGASAMSLADHPVEIVVCVGSKIALVVGAFGDQIIVVIENAMRDDAIAAALRGIWSGGRSAVALSGSGQDFIGLNAAVETVIVIANDIAVGVGVVNSGRSFGEGPAIDGRSGRRGLRSCEPYVRED